MKCVEQCLTHTWCLELSTLPADLMSGSRVSLTLVTPLLLASVIGHLLNVHHFLLLCHLLKFFVTTSVHLPLCPSHGPRCSPCLALVTYVTAAFSDSWAQKLSCIRSGGLSLG